MSENNDKKNEIVKRYLDLPEDLQKALFSAQNSEVIFEIGKKHGLAVDKMGELADETGLVMLGMTKPSEYIKNLTQRLAVEPEKAKAVAEDINQKIFAPIRESLKKIHGITPTSSSLKTHQSLNDPTPPTTVKRELPPISPPPPPKLANDISLPKKMVSVKPPDNLPVEQKVEKIVKEHEIAKQEKREPKIPLKIIMPEIPKGAEEPTESALRIQADEKIPPTSPIIGGRIVEETKPTVPDVFVKKIPFDSLRQNSEQAVQGKPAQEQKDPYKEPI